MWNIYLGKNKTYIYIAQQIPKLLDLNIDCRVWDMGGGDVKAQKKV